MKIADIFKNIVQILYEILANNRTILSYLWT